MENPVVVTGAASIVVALEVEDQEVVVVDEVVAILGHQSIRKYFCVSSFSLFKVLCAFGFSRYMLTSLCYYSPEGGIPQPSPKVENIENATANSLAKTKSPDRVYFPERPGFGTLGRKVLLYANYFELTNVGKGLFRYHVDVVGDEDGRKPTGGKVRRVVGLLIEEHFSDNINKIATDYRSTLISVARLPERATFEVRHKGEYEDDYRENPKVYRVNVQLTGTFLPSDLLNYLSSTSAAGIFESQSEMLQAMNIVMGHHPKANPAVSSVGANKHFSLDPNAAEVMDLGGGLDVLRGFFVSIRAATARLLVNVQVKYAACYQSDKLTHVIQNYKRGNPPNIYKLDNFVKRVKISITHIQRKNGKPRVKTIAGLASTHDGRSAEHPPKVSTHGAGPRDVQFFLESPNQGGNEESNERRNKRRKTSPASGPAAAGLYVSVADFFSRGECLCLYPRFLREKKKKKKVVFSNIALRIQHRYRPSDPCRERRQQGEAHLFACRGLPC